MSLLVNEVFLSLQGEGSFVGTPSVFVRLQGCTCGCPWCDTGYALAVDGRHFLGDDSPAVLAKSGGDPSYTRAGEEWLLARVARMGGHVRHVVLTGGEPCLQDIGPFTAMLAQAGHSVQVETSGTRPIRCAPGTWITLSPKAVPVLEENWAKASEVKLPVASEDDIRRWLSRLRALPAERILLQPVSCGREATALCVRWCLAEGWRLSVQVHKYLDLR